MSSLPGEDLIRIAWDTYNEVLAEFYYPSIPTPQIVMDAQDKNLISVDRENWVLKLNLLALPKNIPGHEVKKFLKIIWRRGVSYYLVCPYDATNAVKILTVAISETDEKVGVLLANLFIELIIMAYLYHRYHDDIIWFVNRVYGNVDWRKLLKSKTGLIYTLLLEKITEKEIVPKKLRGKVPTQMMEACDKAFKALESSGFFIREKWSIAIKDFSRSLKSVLMSKKRVRLPRIFEIKEKVLTEVFHRNPYVPEILRMLQRHSTSAPSDLVELIIAALEAVDKDLIKATPAMKVVGLRTPSELLKQWYRLRAQEYILPPPKKRSEKRGAGLRIPITWQVTDPPEKLDVLVSLSSFPILIPGATTRKWKYVGEGADFPEKPGNEKKILIIIDSSGSMQYFPGWRLETVDEGTKKVMKRLGMKYPPGSKFDLALLTAYIILGYALNVGSDIAVINFSGKALVKDWKSRIDEIENVLGIYQGDGTELPCKELLKFVKTVNRRLLVFLITDSEVYNQEKAQECLIELLNMGHSLYIIHIETLYNLLAISLEEKGARLFKVRHEGDLTKLSNFLARILYD